MPMILAENVRGGNIVYSLFDAETGLDLLNNGPDAKPSDEMVSKPFTIGSVLRVEAYQVVTFLDMVAKTKDQVQGPTDQKEGMVNDEELFFGEAIGNIDGLIYTADIV